MDLCEPANFDTLYDSGNYDGAEFYPGHTSLSEGEPGAPAPVLMAGTFDVDASGNVTSFGRYSGHYMPGTGASGFTSNYMPLEDVARQGLEGFGAPMSNAQWADEQF